VSGAGLFGRMLVEEYRLHAELFGRRRFLALPLVVAVVAGAGTRLLVATGTSPATIVAGIHALVFFFGLQVGTIGLVGRDALRDVLGETTLLVFSGRTLPLSQRRLLGVFVVKDIVYYLAFFLTPLVVGLLALAGGGGLAPTAVPALWVSVGATFALGSGTSLSLASLGGRSKWALVAVVAALVLAVLRFPSASIGLTPYAVYTDPTATNAAVSAAALLVALASGIALFDPAARSGVRRLDPGRFDRLRGLGDVYTARSLLEVSRSSGSVWKAGFSLGVLFAVAGLLLDRLAAATTLSPSGGIAFGTLLGLGTFTTYNWVTQTDAPREFLRYPAGLGAAFRGKRRAFFVLSLPFGLGYLALAAVWYPVAELLVGAAVFPLVSMYVFGLTAYLTGFSPNELLFDTPTFAVYGAGLAAVSVPLLVAALAYGETPAVAVGTSLVLCVGSALVGLLLARRAPARWHDRLRTE
jgi:hypothetical protein